MKEQLQRIRRCEGATTTVLIPNHQAEKEIESHNKTLT
jgi:hypothetical protein